jgi:hypothetical protein
MISPIILVFKWREKLTTGSYRVISYEKKSLYVIANFLRAFVLLKSIKGTSTRPSALICA